MILRAIRMVKPIGDSARRRGDWPVTILPIITEKPGIRRKVESYSR